MAIEKIDAFVCPNLTSVNVSNCPNLMELRFEQSYLLSSLNVENSPALKELSINETSISTLDLSGYANLELLVFSYTPISSLSVSGCTALKTLYGGGTSLLTILDLSGLSSLETLSYNDIDETPVLESIILSGCTMLKNAGFLYTALTDLDFSESPGLESIEITNNPFLENINFSGCTALHTAYLNNNALTSLDMSDCPLTQNFNASSNPLETLFLKNGIDNVIFLYLMMDTNLTYVCTDEEDISEMSTMMGPNVVVNSYCTFIPGGMQNTISGNVRFDNEGNGCDVEDMVMQNVKIEMTGVTESGTAFLDQEGNYIFFAGVETVTIIPQMDSNLFIFSPPSLTQDFESLGNDITADFCIVPNGTHPDLDIVLLPIFDARPGFDATYQLIVTNKGNQVQSGSISLNYNDALIDYIESSEAPATNTTGSLTWDFTDLAPFNNTSINLTFNVNSPLEEPAVNIDDILPFTVSLTTVETDDTPADNIDQFNQLVIGSYDPNDKQVAEGTTITPEQAGDYLHYLIRFQNTGTAEAINVVVKDMLAENLDWNTFQPISASHAYRATLTEGNKAEFFFENIWLPAEEDDEPGSHGFIAFKIKPNAGAAVGDIFENTAEIYFDFNAPIITNTVTTGIQVLGTPDFELGQYFMLYPNPAKDMVYITPKQEIAIESVTIYNLLGQEIMGIKIGSAVDAITVNVAGLQGGHYLIEVKTEKGRAVRKLVKQ